MKTLFITGTDTDVGKTYVTSWLLRQLANEYQVGAYKPACSGSELNDKNQPVWHDVEQLHASVNVDVDRSRICPQCFTAPLAPPVAAREENREVNWEQIQQGYDWWQNKADVLLIEGVGGLLCPVTEQQTIADLISIWQTPTLIVSRLGLGAINHTLLTVEVAQQRNLNPVGILFSQTSPEETGRAVETNPQEVADRTGVPVWGVLFSGATMLHDLDGRPVSAEQLRIRLSSVW